MSDTVTITLPREQWEAVIKANNIALHVSERAKDEMCPNCVTPWKCNGPHEVYRFDDEMLTELIATIDSIDAYMEMERRGIFDGKWVDVANGEWQELMKLIYQVVNRIEKAE